MLDIIIYAFSIMYTPGPVNLLSLNAGLQRQVDTSVRFSMGVGLAMLVLFLSIGYTGAVVFSTKYHLISTILGSIYISYLAYKLLRASFVDSADYIQPRRMNLDFKAGFIMQLSNPKALIAILPIVSVQFPAAQITGIAIAVWSIGLSLLAVGAPMTYLFVGARMSYIIKKPIYFRVINRLMAFLLIYTVWSMLSVFWSSEI